MGGGGEVPGAPRGLLGAGVGEGRGRKGAPVDDLEPLPFSPAQTPTPGGSGLLLPQPLSSRCYVGVLPINKSKHLKNEPGTILPPSRFLIKTNNSVKCQPVSPFGKFAAWKGDYPNDFLKV